MPAGLLAGAALVLAIALGLSLASRGNQTGASASPSATASPTPSSTPSPTALSFDVRLAAAIAQVPACDAYNGRPHVISGEYLYVVCYPGYSDTAPFIARLDLTTNKVVSRYEPNSTVPNRVALDGGLLWSGGTLGSGCVAPCKGLNHVLVIDPVTGDVKIDLSDWKLKGDGFGYVWATDASNRLTKLDPATGAVKGRIPFAYDTMQIACGSLWGLTVNSPATADESTTVARVDPADGSVLATFTEPGLVGQLELAGDECWAPAYSGPIPGAGQPQPGFNHFDRIGQSGIEFRTPEMSSSLGYVAIFEGTYWRLTANTFQEGTTSLAMMQRIDPATWQPAGTVWTYTGAAPGFAAGGSLWGSSLPDNSPATSALVRLDVPLTVP